MLVSVLTIENLCSSLFRLGHQGAESVKSHKVIVDILLLGSQVVFNLSLLMLLYHKQQNNEHVYINVQTKLLIVTISTLISVYTLWVFLQKKHNVEKLNGYFYYHAHADT